jgi:hypothetical protein
MGAGDFEKPKINYVGADFALSKKDKANRTSFSIAGKDMDNILHFIDQRVDRLDILEIVEEMFSIQLAWQPDVFFVEGGAIWLAIEPILTSEMRARDIWISFEVIQPIADKKVRGRAYQRRMRAKGCRFAKDTYWYPGFESENMRFTGDSDALLDDQFDSAAILCRGLETFTPIERDDFLTESEEEFIYQSEALRAGSGGRSLVTGY